MAKMRRGNAGKERAEETKEMEVEKVESRRWSGEVEWKKLKKSKI